MTREPIDRDSLRARKRQARLRGYELQMRERHERQRGYDDGYAGRPAASSLAVYQAGWRRGREAREAGNDAA